MNIEYVNECKKNESKYIIRLHQSKINTKRCPTKIRQREKFGVAQTQQDCLKVALQTKILEELNSTQIILVLIYNWIQ